MRREDRKEKRKGGESLLLKEGRERRGGGKWKGEGQEEERSRSSNLPLHHR